VEKEFAFFILSYLKEKIKGGRLHSSSCCGCSFSPSFAHVQWWGGNLKLDKEESNETEMPVF